MANNERNPFDPSLGTPPRIILPNYQSDFEGPASVAQAIAYDDPNRVIFITGLRGSGKTALLTQIEQQVMKLANTYVVEIDNNQRMVQSFGHNLKNIFKIHGLTDKIAAISVMGFGLSFSKSNEDYTTQDIENFMAMLTKLHKRIVIFIDEFNHKKKTPRNLSNSCKTWSGTTLTSTWSLMACQKWSMTLSMTRRWPF